MIFALDDWTIDAQEENGRESCEKCGTCITLVYNTNFIKINVLQILKLFIIIPVIKELITTVIFFFIDLIFDYFIDLDP